MAIHSAKSIGNKIDDIPTTEIRMMEMWDAPSIDTTNRWTIDITGGGAITLNRTGLPCGVVDLVCDATESCFIETKHISSVLPPTTAYRIENTKVGVDILTKMTGALADIDTDGIFIGFNTNMDGVDHAAGIIYRANKWQMITKDGTTETTNDVPIPVTHTDWNLWRIIVGYGYVAFLLNDVVIGQHLTNLPAQGPQLGGKLAVKTGASGSFTLHLGAIVHYYIFPAV